jgi:hypothetical protein
MGIHCSVNGANWEHHASVNGGWSSQGRDNPSAIFVEFGSFYQKMLIFNSSSKRAPALDFHSYNLHKDNFFN